MAKGVDMDYIQLVTGHFGLVFMFDTMFEIKIKARGSLSQLYIV